MPTKSSRLSFDWCSIAQALTEGLADLAEANYAEVETYVGHFPLDINWGAYQMAERRGELRSIAARAGGNLVGYASYSIQPLSQNQTVLCAVNRVVYMAPRHRGWGSLELLDDSERRLKDLGVQMVIYVVKEPNSTDGRRSANLASLLVRRGCDPYERHFSKVLK